MKSKLAFVLLVILVELLMVWLFWPVLTGPAA